MASTPDEMVKRLRNGKGEPRHGADLPELEESVEVRREERMDLEAIKGRLAWIRPRVADPKTRHLISADGSWLEETADHCRDLVAEIERQRAAIEELRDECRAEAVRSRETGWAQSEWAYAEIAEKLAAILAKD